MVEVDEQGTGTLGGSGTLDVVRQFADAVVALRLHGLCQYDGRLVWILPGEVEQTVVCTEAGGFQRYFLRSEGQAEIRLDDEADGIALVSSRDSAFRLVLLRLGHELSLILAGAIDREIAAVGHLAGHEVVVGLTEVGLLILNTETEGEVGGDGLIVEGSQFVITAASTLVGDGHTMEIHLTARLHHQREGGGRTCIFERGYAAIGIRLGRQRADGLSSSGIDDSDVGAVAILAVDNRNRSIACDRQVDLLVIIECPSVRGVVVVGLVAHDLNTLVVCRVEVDISQVIGVGEAWEGILDGCGYGIERDVTLYEVFRLIFLAALGFGVPAAEDAAENLRAVFGTKGKLADGLLTLHLLGADNGRAVEVVVGERVLCVEGCNLFLSEGTDGHVWTIVHAGDSQSRSFALIVEHVDIVLVVLPAARTVGSLRGYHIT